MALLLATGGAAMPAFAQDPAEAAGEQEVSAAEIERMVRTLEDPQARERLVSQLKVLLQAKQRAEEAEAGPVTELLAGLSDRVETLGNQMLAAAGVVSDLPRLADWVQAQFRDREARTRWAEVISKFIVLMVAGFAVERAMHLLVRGPRQALRDRRADSALVRVPLVLVLTLVELVPVAVAAAAAYALLPLLDFRGDARVAAFMLVVAYAVARSLTIAARMAFMPASPGLRPVRVGDETAHYLYLWSRRLVAVTVYGYVLATAARLLGLPKSGHDFALKALGLVVTTLVVIFILQNRQPVAEWIRSRGGGQVDPRLRQLRNRLADVWHVLTILYVVGIFVVFALQIRGGFEYMLRGTLLTVAILLLAGFLSALVKRAIDRAFAVSQELRQELPQLEPRANRYLPVMHWVLRAVLLVITALALLQAWGVDTLDWIASDLGRRVVGGLTSIGIVLLIALLVWELASSAIERYLAPTDGHGNAVERSARARTLLPLLRKIILVLLVVIVGLIVLSELGVNIAPLLAGAGVVGLAVGFGSQKLVQDLITGAFILFEDTIAVGDVVKLGEHAGLVEAISIRTISLRDLNGNVHTIPFSSVGTVMNMTKGFSYYVLDVGVAYREDTDEVAAVLKEIGAELQADPELGKFILEPVEILGVDRFDASAVVIKGRIKTQPLKQWQVGREFNRRMKKRFDALGIEIPFPHTTVYFGEDKQGSAPPMRVRLEGGADRRSPPASPSPTRGDEVDLPTRHEAGLRSEEEQGAGR